MIKIVKTFVPLIALFMPAYLRAQSTNNNNYGGSEGDFQKIDSITLVIQNASDSKDKAALYLARGNAEARLRRFKAADNDYGMAITLNPDLRVAYQNRATLYEIINKYDDAIKDYEKAISLYQDDSLKASGFYARIGLLQYTLKAYAKSLEADSLSLALDPNNGLARADEGWVYLDIKHYDKAIASFTASMESYKNNRKSLCLIITGRANAKRHLDKYREAIDDYTLALQFDSTHSPARWNRALSYNLNGDYNLSIAEYTCTMDFFKGDSTNLAKLYDERADAEINARKFRESLTDDSVALSYNRQFSRCYWHIANIYEQRGDFELSTAAYKEALKHFSDPGMLAAINNGIAGSTYILGDYEQVISSSTTAISLNKQLWNSYLLRGRAYLKKTDKKGAEADFDVIIKMDTTRNDDSYAFAHFFAGDGNKAIQLMQANIIATTNPALLLEHYYNIACLYSLMNRPHEANVFLKKCTDAGYSKKYALADPDLNNLHSSPDFKDIMGLK